MTHLLVLHHCMVHHRTHSLVHHQCRPQVHHQCHPQVRITTYPQFPSCKIHSHAGFSFSPSPLPHSSPVSPPSPGNVIIVCTVCNVCYHYRVSFFHSKIPDEGDVCDTEQALVDYALHISSTSSVSKNVTSNVYVCNAPPLWSYYFSYGTW